MRPTNLNQVFVINNSLCASGTVFDKYDGTNGFNALAASANRGGVWTFESTGAGTHTYSTSPASLMASSLEYFQVTQGTTGAYPIASPIIRPKQIRRVKYMPYVASQRHTQAATFSATVPTGNTYLVKIALRTMPIAYEAFANPSNTALDLSGGAKIFPLIGNFSAGRDILQVVEIAAGTTAANCGIAVTNAIQANTQLNNMFTVSDNGAGVVTVIARHVGVIFDLVAFNSVTDTSVVTVATTGWDAGVGNYWQAISDEKQQRSKYGNFNRMYFPTVQTDYAQATFNYDVLEVSYDHNHPSDTGIARPGEWNTIRMYIRSNSTTAWAGTTAGTAVWDEFFGFGAAAGTAFEAYY
jgi:hypothetical protein